MAKEAIKTRKDEIRYKTLEPKKMLNMWTAQKVCRYWMEEFLDEDKGEVVSIKRSETIVARGVLITQDVLQKMQFWMQEGALTEPIEVSNQNRLAQENISTYFSPWTIQVQIDNKKHKFLAYATDITTLLDIVKDYVELNYVDGFTILSAKEMDSCIILEDTLTSKDIDLEKAYLSEEISFDEYTHAKAVGGDEDESEVYERKFYQMDVTILFSDNIQNEFHFIVHTFDTDKALACIGHHIHKREVEIKKNHEEHGWEPHEIRDFKIRIEKVQTMPVNYFIPKEFSEAYATQE